METKTMTAEERAALLANLSPEEKQALARELNTEATTEQQRQKEAYESIRSEFLTDVKKRVGDYRNHGRTFKSWLRDSCTAYAEILKGYGQLKRDDQLGFTLVDDDLRFHVKGSRVKGFDERADVAEKRLTEFLLKWVNNTADGMDNPMYKLAMMMIQRNEAGDLDYKSISRLYELEDNFNDLEYSAIMQLFKESNTVEGTATHFYFEERDQNGKWQRMEISFNRL
jgi:hypothetical protein